MYSVPFITELSSVTYNSGLLGPELRIWDIIWGPELPGQKNDFNFAAAKRNWQKYTSALYIIVTLSLPLVPDFRAQKNPRCNQNVRPSGAIKHEINTCWDTFICCLLSGKLGTLLRVGVAGTEARSSFANCIALVTAATAEGIRLCELRLREPAPACCTRTVG